MSTPARISPPQFPNYRADDVSSHLDLTSRDITLRWIKQLGLRLIAKSRFGIPPFNSSIEAPSEIGEVVFPRSKLPPGQAFYIDLCFIGSGVDSAYVTWYGEAAAVQPPPIATAPPSAPPGFIAAALARLRVSEEANASIRAILEAAGK